MAVHCWYKKNMNSRKLKKISPKLNIAGTVLSDLEEFQEKTEQVLVQLYTQLTIT